MTRIIIIENNKENIEKLRKMVEPMATSFQSYLTGEAILGQITPITQNGQGLPAGALIFVGDNLPGITPFQLIQTLAALDPTAQFCLMCDEFNANKRDVSKSIGVVCWLDRPLDVQRVQSLIKAKQDEVLPILSKGTIGFKVKSVRMSIERTGDTVVCAGAIDDFAWFERILGLGITGDTININWDQITDINIEGVKGWGRFIADQGESVKSYCFQKCPVPLVHFLNMMTQFFDQNITVESFYLPTFNHQSQRFDAVLIDKKGLDVAPHDADKLKQAIKKYMATTASHQEVACDLNSFIPGLVTDTGPSENIWINYLQYFDAVNQNARMELIMTRNAVLDQCSKIVGRYAGFGAAVALLDSDFTFKCVTRGEIIPQVLGCYSDVTYFVESVSEIIKVLTLKWLRHQEGCSSRKIQMDVQNVLARVEQPLMPDLVQAFMHSKVTELEMAYEESGGDQEILIQFSLACLSVLQDLLAMKCSGINDSGAVLIIYFQELFKPEKMIAQVRELIGQIKSSGKTVDESTYRKLQSKAMLSWTDGEVGPHLIEEVCLMMEAFNDDFERVITVMCAHDLITQLFEHRVFEISLLCNQVDNLALVQGIDSKLVTVIEKSAFSFYFSAFQQEPPAPSMDFDEVTFF